MNRQKTTSNAVLRRIRGHGRGWIFTISDFLDLGTENSLKKALSRLWREGIIRRIARGIYDYPRLHKKLGILSPNPDDVAAALAARTGSRLQISGGRAANLFGLTTQVPAQLVYLTDGPPRRIKVEGQTIQIRRARPSKFPGTGTPAGLAIQAMRAVGPSVDKKLLFQRLSERLTTSDKLHLIKLRRHAPRWTQEVIHQLEATIDGQMGEGFIHRQKSTFHRDGRTKKYIP